MFWGASCSQHSRFPENRHVGSGSPGTGSSSLSDWSHSHLTEGDRGGKRGKERGRERWTAAIEVTVHLILLVSGFCYKNCCCNSLFPDNITLFTGQPPQPCSLINSAYYSISQLEVTFSNSFDRNNSPGVTEEVMACFPQHKHVNLNPCILPQTGKYLLFHTDMETNTYL